jgi:drug/metabolite transporter (DMT)-like permease
VWGLNTTTPALSAIFTSLACAWVPLVVWVVGHRLSAWTVGGFALSVLGTLVFAVPDRDAALGTGLKLGDWLTMLASLLFAGQILVLDRLGRHARPGHLTAGFFAVPGVVCLALATAAAAAGPGLAAWWGWVCAMLQSREVQWTVAKLILLPSVLSFHWMNTYQPRVTASRAALVYLLEPVFAAVFSVCQGHEPLTLVLVLGGSLILTGNVLAEAPNWLPGKGKPS